MRNVMNVFLVAVLLICSARGVWAAPTVTAVSPDPSTLSATPISTNFVVTFSEAMDPATITGTTATIYLTPATAATVTYNSATRQATLSPTTALLPGINNPNPSKRVAGTAYNLTVSGARNLTGTPVTAASFNYPVTPSLTLDPYDGQTDIATLRYKISVAFTEAMDPTTITGTTTTFTVSANGVAIAGSVSPATVYGDYTPNKYVFLPAAPLVAGTEYTATLSNGIRTLANGKYLPASVTWKFSTVRPTVTATSPAPNATDVAIGTTVQAFLSLATNPSSFTETTFTLSAGSTPVAGTVTYDSNSNSATFTPTAALMEGTTYTAVISSPPLSAPYSWSFTTLYPPVKLLPSGLFYDFLQVAYNTSNAGDTITLLARVYDFKEKLDFNKQVSVLLRGGFDSGFATQTGYATLNGDVTVTSGVLTVDRLIVAP